MFGNRSRVTKTRRSHKNLSVTKQKFRKFKQHLTRFPLSFMKTAYKAVSQCYSVYTQVNAVSNYLTSNGKSHRNVNKTNEGHVNHYVSVSAINMI